MVGSGVEISAPLHENSIPTFSRVSRTGRTTRIPAETGAVQTFLNWNGAHAARDEMRT